MTKWAKAVSWGLLVAALGWAIGYIDFNPVDLVLSGQDAASFALRLFPPDFSRLDLIFNLALESLSIAILGTAIGLAISIPVGALAARTSGLPSPLGPPARLLIAVTRAIPGLVFAIVFVQIVGPGPTAGVIALALNSIGMMGKLFAEAIDAMNHDARRALSASGVGRLSAFSASTAPMLFPTIVATTLHRLDINFRYSAVLGIVGAGGIGIFLQYSIQYFDYQSAVAGVVIIIVAVWLLEFVSNALRRRIMSLRPASRFGMARVSIISLLSLSVLAAVAASLGIEFHRLASMPTKFAELAVKMVPPDFSSYSDQLLQGFLQSVSMALIATVIGGLIAVPLGFLAARPVSGRLLRLAARGTSQIVRGVPDLVLALFLVSALGLGPSTGALVMSIGTLGFLTKFVADSVEELDLAAYQLMLSSGASRTQAVIATLVPQAKPILISHLFYTLDINFRLSALMGVVGAGGIGAAIIAGMRVSDYETAFAAMLIVFFSVVTIEFLSKMTKGIQLFK